MAASVKKWKRVHQRFQSDPFIQKSGKKRLDRRAGGIPKASSQPTTDQCQTNNKPRDSDEKIRVPWL